VRLLVAIPYFTPAWAYGGSVTVADALVRGLVAAGHDVTVATTDVLDERKRIAPDAPAEPEGAEVVRFPNVSHRLAATVAGYMPRGYRRWLRQNIDRFDVVLLQDVYTFVSVGAARAAEKAGVPYALQPLGTLSPAAERGRPLAKRVFLTLFANRTVHRAAACLHSTEFERQDFLDVGARPEQLVKVPLPLELPDPNASVPRDHRPTVVSVGRLHPIKGLDRLIQAHALVLRDVPEALLVIAGPGDAYRKQLERVAADAGVADSVTFPGFISQEEKVRLLRSADVSALLSASEGLPMAALEAMACGTPVVLSEGCHFTEADGRAGIVVPGDPESAARALTELLTDSERREELGAGAAELARDYRAESVVPLMAEVLGGISRATSAFSSST
jgi:glycosyltransferase involved in cell wall biosynthesis